MFLRIMGYRFIVDAVEMFSKSPNHSSKEPSRIQARAASSMKITMKVVISAIINPDHSISSLVL